MKKILKNLKSSGSYHTEPLKPDASDEDVARMWNHAWMSAHRDELGRFGSKILQGLEEGMSLKDVATRCMLGQIEARVEWNDLTDFERMFHRVFKEGFERWKTAKEAVEKGIGQTHH